MAAVDEAAHALPSVSPFDPAVREYDGPPLLAMHDGPGAATRRSQALRVAARAFDVILFDGAEGEREILPPRPHPQAVIAPVPEPPAVFIRQPRTAGETWILDMNRNPCYFSKSDEDLKLPLYY